MVNIWKCLAECNRTLHLSKTRFWKISPAEKKSLAITRWRSSLKVDKKETKTIIEQRWKQMNTSRNKWKIRQYTNNREMCETMFSSQTRQNVHISTPPSPPCPFQREYNGSLKNRKDGIVFPVLKVIQDVLFVRLFLYVADSFFFCFRGCFSPNVVILYSGTGERGSSWETLRGASKEVKNPVCAYRRNQTFRRLASRDERRVSFRVVRRHVRNAYSSEPRFMIRVNLP